MAMSEQTQPVAGAAASTTKARTSFGILGAISLSHLLNDMIQSLILAIYPLLQSEFSLTFMQIGMITLTFQLASSLLQPVVGYWTDKYPMPWSLPIGMCFTLSGLVLLALAGSFGAVLLAAALVGTGSSVFHPESSRVARMASGGRHGLAQSIFQVGGNFGSSLGPLLAAVIIAPYGKGNVAWFVLAALLAIVVLAQISRWYSAQHRMNKGKPKATIINPLPRNKVVLAVSILLILIFSKYFYMASISSYYTFYLMQKFGLSIQNAQLHLFAFLFAVAAGTVIGGPVGDKIGRKYVIWGSILGVAPFTLILPYASLHWTGVLTVIIGFILASAFSAILVYAQELLPGRIGMVSGLFFGFAFGMGGLGAAVLGLIADHTSIELGMALNLLPQAGQNLVLAGAILSIMLNPVLFALLEKYLAKTETLEEQTLEEAIEEEKQIPVDICNHALLVGYGRVGSLLGEKLLASDIPLVVIETSRTRVDELRERGVRAVLGNAANEEIMQLAHLECAKWLILTIPNGYEAGEIVASARAKNPDIEIIARAHYDDEVAYITERGANQVVMGEREIARTMLELLETPPAGEVVTR